MNQTQTTIVSDSSPIMFKSLDYNPIATVVIFLLGLLVLVFTSGAVTRLAFNQAGVDVDEDDGSPKDTGTVIGKIENILIFTLILIQAYTALGIIFAAKSIVRKSDMDTGDTSYYLTGTLANFTYSTMIGIIVHISMWSLIRFGLFDNFTL